MVVLGACGGGEETASTTGSDTVPELQPPEPTTSAAGETGAEPTTEPPTPAPVTPSDAERVIEAVFTGSAPAEEVCGDLLTPEAVEASYGSQENCLAAQRPSALADSVDVKELDEVAGTAIVVPEGGLYDAAEITVTLVDDDGTRVGGLAADVPAGP